VQAFQFGLIFYLSSFYLKYRKLDNNILETKHYGILIFIAYLFAMLQVSFLVVHPATTVMSMTNIVQLFYPLLACFFGSISFFYSTKSSRMLMEDFEEEPKSNLSHQSRILLYKLHKLIRNGRIAMSVYFSICFLGGTSICFNLP
jgi:hypothetical protein